MRKGTERSTAWGSSHRQRVDRLVHGEPRDRLKRRSCQAISDRMGHGALNTMTLNHWVVGSIPTRCMLKREILRHILTYVSWLSFESARPLF
jgi:hypothetical protein